MKKSPKQACTIQYIPESSAVYSAFYHLIVVQFEKCVPTEPKLKLSRKLDMLSNSKSIDDLLLTPGYVESPYEVFDLLRTEAPVYWSEKWNGWVLTRYDDVLNVLKDFKRLSNGGRYTEYLSTLATDELAQLTYLQNHYERGGLVQADPPSHNRLRKLIGNAFTPRMVNEMGRLVSQISDDLIDSFVGMPEVELIYNFAFALPATVIAGMLGVPIEQRDQFKDWSAAIQRFLGTGKVDFQSALEAQEAWRNMNDFFTQLLLDRTSHPQEDLISGFVQSYEEGERLTKEEIIGTCGAMLVAGHETTTNLISNAIWLLLQDQEQLKQLKENPSLYPSAIEEFLRYESPFQCLPRTLREDVEIDGIRMRKGQLVYAMLGAANRDPCQFDNPEQLDLHRENNKHLAFGYGVHFCLGAPLARLEAHIAIQTLLERLPQMQLDQNRPPDWKRSMVQRGMESFWLCIRS
ncbi:cytochrome P450 [Adhaeretor mobilis]|uniref:Biotin biosynthesis cytochrome P450 n=1 Tax=Adhaeretor mobilis TaxID=1930276 RepID=A0A517MVC3_9BACT|nr:cytochrome P450 [Adhaeretor mobilis]QDS98829.1 Biotin biosynthesis cytochrome P450 [Adhaeretor mobilis]